jgi:NAD(P)-dependent dehydrogenase (short-subunit alcohol dehydrogenase family)
MTDKPLAGRIVLVTGASRGIGYFAAREIAAQGAHVIAVARTVGGLEELDDEIQSAGGSATLVPADLREYDSIDRLGAAIFERWGKLDGLVANAGALGVLSPVAHVAPKDFEQAFALNVTTNYRLIRSLDLLLRQSDAGRALFVTSGAARHAQPYWATYAASKAALDMLVTTWALEMRSTSVKVNLVNPGPLRTAMRNKAFPGEDAETLQHPSVLAPEIARLISPAFADHGTLFDFPTGTSTSVLG